MKIETFSQETRENIYDAYNGICCVEGCYEKIIDFHHRLHNTKLNRKKFPLLIQSVINCAPCCRLHHKFYNKYPELNMKKKVAKIYERYLRNLKESQI